MPTDSYSNFGLADIAVLREQPWRLTIRDFLAHWGQTRRTGTVKCTHPE